MLLKWYFGDWETLASSVNLTAGKFNKLNNEPFTLFSLGSSDLQALHQYNSLKNYDKDLLSLSTLSLFAVILHFLYYLNVFCSFIIL